MFALNARNQIVLNGVRPDFPQAVYNAVPTGPNEDVCHSFSYDLIENWMFELRQNLAGLNALAAAVYVGAVPANITAMIAGYVTETVPANIVAAANQLLVEFNNALPNLRAGLACWNRGIGNYFDPCDWVHFDSAGNIDSAPGGVGVYAWPSTVIPAPAGAQNAFYLFDQNDCNRLRLAIPIPVTTPITVIANRGVDIAGNPIQFIHSSNNNFGMSRQRVYPGHPIYYYNTVTHTWTRV